MKQTYLTGIKPTGIPHIGNYFGAIKPAIELTKSGEYNYFYFIADYHALNMIKNKEELKENILDLACTWLACGLDPEKVVFYQQSGIPEITELTTILSNVTPKGLLNRAHAYKASVDKNIENGQEPDNDVNMGLFNYPLLMTADIAIMNGNKIPVGQDQKQHVEIARDVVKYFNKYYGKVLAMPTELIEENTKTILGTDGRKMSKSYGNVIPLFASEEVLKKLISQIKTDSSLPNEPKDKDSTIFSYYKLFASPEQLKVFKHKFDTGISWAEAKAELFEVANAYLTAMREKYNYYKQNPSLVIEILKTGNAKARAVAKETLARVKNAIGVNLYENK